MTFKPEYPASNFQKISIDSFIKKYKASNPNSDIVELNKNLLYFQQLRKDGINCNCGNPIWIIGSAISGKGCFTCITGETDSSEDYEVE
ncbi:hypothetical protein [Solitalea lacus]|uniref:hypothetical protein n=1 Tax=Solitalea lacus TaxID=2911172 RepID=UPI001EDB9E62|nr:hypothetical protein [Solitalea lacus]UKJ06938.1 hypothetical protein L2B55_15575 [Solitalea lacus]